MKILNDYKALKIFVENHDSYVIHNNKLFCNVCDVEKFYIPREGISPLKIHLTTDVHSRNLSLKKRQQRLNFESIENSDAFSKDLILFMCRSNIPYLSIELPAFKDFILQYTGKILKNESFYCKNILPIIHQENIN